MDRMPNLDFFISYAYADTNWAKWVDFVLRENGYECLGNQPTEAVSGRLQRCLNWWKSERKA